MMFPNWSLGIQLSAYLLEGGVYTLLPIRKHTFFTVLMESSNGVHTNMPLLLYACKHDCRCTDVVVISRYHLTDDAVLLLIPPD